MPGSSQRSGLVLRQKTATEPHSPSPGQPGRRDGLADRVGVKPDGNGFSGIVFNYVVRSESRVAE